MKTNNITKTIVREKTKNYGEQEEIKKHILVWILTTDGEMLIKKLHHGAKVTANNLTIHAQTLKDAICTVERETGILCQHDLFRKVYSHFAKRHNIKDETYFLCVNLDKEHKELVEDISESKFIDYREVMSYLARFDLTMSTKDKVLSFISTLYEKYSFL